MDEPAPRWRNAWTVLLPLVLLAFLVWFGLPVRIEADPDRIPRKWSAREIRDLVRLTVYEANEEMGER